MPNVELLNVDCMEYMRALPDKAFDLAIVDPPYGIGEDGSRNHSRGLAAKSKNYRGFYGADISIPKREYFTELVRVSCNQIIWGGNYMVENLKPSMGWVFWDKHMEAQDFSDGELAYTSFSVGLKKFDFAWNGMIQGDMKNKEFRIHPTQKPIKLYRWLLTNYAKEGDKIIDTHLGSGSSAIAAHQMGFDFVGTEIDPEYHAAAVKRFYEQTKQISLFPNGKQV
jgi:site-specific DNA-methyltransferase (adenine-specific)